MVDMYNGIDLDSEESGPKALREALKKQKAENETLRKNFETLNKDLRTRTVADALKQKGVSEEKVTKVAQFVPEDADVDQWVADNGDLFGIQVQASTSTEAAAPTQHLPRCRPAVLTRFLQKATRRKARVAPTNPRTRSSVPSFRNTARRKFSVG